MTKPMPENRIKLRNKICSQLQAWEKRLEISNIHIDPTPISRAGHDKLFHRFIHGIAKGGRAILIYPIIKRTEQMPKGICAYMMNFELAGGIVGCADGISDAWDICYPVEGEYTRKQKTYLYRWWGNYYRKRGEKNGSDAEE